MPALIYQGAVKHGSDLIRVALVTGGENVQKTADEVFSQLKYK
jgi:hypothetical protein